MGEDELAGTDDTEPTEPTLGDSVSTTDRALLTYLAVALNDVGGDELVTRITDSSGSQIDPATSALEDALESVGSDKFGVNLYAEDDAGNAAEVQAEELGTALGGTETAVVTKIVEALSTVGNAQVRIETPNPIDVSAAEIDVDLNSQSLSEVTTQEAQLAGLAHGQDTVASSGTAEALNGGTSLTVPDGAALRVKALPGNSGNVYVGDSDVSSSNGYVLASGDPETFYVDDVSTVFIDVDTGGEGVSWAVEQ